MSAMSSCFQLSRFRELGKKIVGTGRTYRFCVFADYRNSIEVRDQLIYEGRGVTAERMTYRMAVSLSGVKKTVKVLQMSHTCSIAIKKSHTNSWDNNIDDFSDQVISAVKNLRLSSPSQSTNCGLAVCILKMNSCSTVAQNY